MGLALPEDIMGLMHYPPRAFVGQFGRDAIEVDERDWILLVAILKAFEREHDAAGKLYDTMVSVMRHEPTDDDFMVAMGEWYAEHEVWGALVDKLPADYEPINPERVAEARRLQRGGSNVV